MSQEKANMQPILKNNSPFATVFASCVVCGTKVKTMQIALNEPVYCDFCRKNEEYAAEKKQIYAEKIPAGFRHMSFETFSVSNDNRTAFDYAKQFRTSEKGVYLLGNVGVGKTHLLISAASDLIYNSSYGRKMKILFYDDIIDTKIKGINKYAIIDDCLQYEYLFIDDVLSVGRKDDALDILSVVLNQRIRKYKRKIFLTSNIAPQDLGDIRVTSRINGMCDIVEVSGTDKRLEGCL